MIFHWYKLKWQFEYTKICSASIIFFLVTIGEIVIDMRVWSVYIHRYTNNISVWSKHHKPNRYICFNRAEKNIEIVIDIHIYLLRAFWYSPSGTEQMYAMSRFEYSLGFLLLFLIYIRYKTFFSSLLLSAFACTIYGRTFI